MNSDVLLSRGGALYEMDDAALLVLVSGHQVVVAILGLFGLAAGSAVLKVKLRGTIRDVF